VALTANVLRELKTLYLMDKFLFVNNSFSIQKKKCGQGLQQLVCLCNGFAYTLCVILE